MHIIFMSLCQQRKTKTKKKKRKRKRKRIRTKAKNICKKVDRKPERVVYTKGGPREREREKIQKVD